MPQSLSNIILHIVFSTKDRQMLIEPELDRELHAYLAMICKSNGCHPIKVGGTSNHVHIGCYLGRTITTAKILEELKRNSSKWIKSRSALLKDFYWQKGYGVFSIGESQVSSLESYISKQREHHKKRTFEEELRDFLKKYNLNYDEKYLWD